MKIDTQIALYKDYLDYKKFYKETTDDNWDMKITFEEWVFDMFAGDHVEIDETWTEKDLQQLNDD
jgi:hypothetical protein